MCSGERTPVLRLRQYRNQQHKFGFDGWWCCTACEARGPDLNETFCSSYTHKGWKNTNSDRTDQDSDDNYPGHKVRMGANNIMVENHKDKNS
eukprot:16444578-Heterocapsa_arctica.AAC.1